MPAHAVGQRLDKRMGSGWTWACLLAGGVGSDGDIEVVAKFSAGCARDWRACRRGLGRDARG